MKKRFFAHTFILLVVFSAVLLPSLIQCSGVPSEDILEEENPLPPDIANLLDEEFIPAQAPSNSPDTCFDKQTIVNLLTGNFNENINVLPILENDLYLSTVGPVTRRSLLDEPALIPDHFCNTYWSLSGDLFYNFYPRVFFRKNSAFIRDYIDINSENIIAVIDKAGEAPGMTDFIPDDIPGILGLFSTIKLQQHRAGLMVSFARQWENFFLTGRIPLYYMLENFYLTQAEIDRIKNNPFFDSADATTSEEEVKRFFLKHLVGDRFGIGDGRLSLLAHAVNCPGKNLWFGLLATIPTSRTFKRGLLGGEFDPDMPIPPFSLQHIFNIANIPGLNTCIPNLPPGQQQLAQNTLITEMTDFLVSALDRLSTILINAPLGNGKHWGFGPQLDFRYCLNEYFSMHTYSSCEWYTPHHESRFFLISKAAQDLNRNWADPAHVDENLSALNFAVLSTLFPAGVKTSVHPGMRFQINHAFLYKTRHFDMRLGFDYWYQGHECLRPLLPIIPVGKPLVLNKAIRPAAQQGKLFAALGYYDNLFNCIDWHVSLNTDATVFHEGIGKSYTISIRLGLEF